MKIFSKNRYHNAKIYSLDAGLYQIVVESDDGREIFGEISFKIKKDRTFSIFSIKCKLPLFARNDIIIQSYHYRFEQC